MSALAMIDPSGNDMKKVRYDAGTDKQLTFGVIINAPWIAKTMSNCFKTVLCRVIFPNASINIHTLSFKEVLRKRLIVRINLPLSNRFSDF